MHKDKHAQVAWTVLLEVTTFSTKIKAEVTGQKVT